MLYQALRLVKMMRVKLSPAHGGGASAPVVKYSCHMRMVSGDGTCEQFYPILRTPDFIADDLGYRPVGLMIVAQAVSLFCAGVSQYSRHFLPL
jgi:hypothetical protein